MATVYPNNLKMVQTRDSLSHFLQGEEEAAAILQPLNHSSTTSPCSEECHELLALVSHVFFTISSFVLRGLCLTDLSRRALVLSRHALAHATAIKTHRVFQEHFLAKSVNTHRKGTEDFYLLRHIPAPPFSLAGPICYPISSEVKPFQEEGLCRGMCFWFLHLYFKTKNPSQDPHQHIRAVGKQFERGATRQAALLQSLTSHPIYDLLQLNVQEDVLRVHTESKTEAQITTEIHSLQPGVYGIYTSNHQLIFIKETPTLQFLFDPNRGTFQIPSPLLLEKALHPSLIHHDASHHIVIDRYLRV